VLRHEQTICMCTEASLTFYLSSLMTAQKDDVLSTKFNVVRTAEVIRLIGQLIKVIL
jgi:hypothetical protein